MPKGDVIERVYFVVSADYNSTVVSYETMLSVISDAIAEAGFNLEDVLESVVVGEEEQNEVHD